MKLNLENAKLFNASLKKILSTITNQKIRVSIINSYKFPNCYVQVFAEKSFENELRLSIFDTFIGNRAGLLDDKDVYYGNIQSTHITGKVFQWENFINQLNSKL